MASSTLPALPGAAALSGPELIYGVQSGVDSKITATQVATYVNGQFSGDATVNNSGVVTCTKTASNPFGVLATATVPLSLANGGTGTATPALVQGSNITITGSWPNQTIAASLPASSGIPLAHGGRLTLQSAIPVMGSSSTAATTLYYAPYSKADNPQYISI